MEHKKQILNFRWKSKRAGITKIIFKKNNKAGLLSARR